MVKKAPPQVKGGLIQNTVKEEPPKGMPPPRKTRCTEDPPERDHQTGPAQLDIDGFCVMDHEAEDEKEVVEMATRIMSDAAFEACHPWPETHPITYKYTNEDGQKVTRKIPPLPTWGPEMFKGSIAKESREGPQMRWKIQASTDEIVVCPFGPMKDQGDRPWRVATRETHLRSLKHVSELYFKEGLFPMKCADAVASKLGVEGWEDYKPWKSFCVSAFTTCYASYVLHLFHMLVKRQIEAKCGHVRVMGVGEQMLLDMPAGGAKSIRHIDEANPNSFSAFFSVKPSCFIRKEATQQMKASGVKSTDMSKVLYERNGRSGGGNWWSMESEQTGELEQGHQNGPLVMQWTPNQREIVCKATPLQKAKALACFDQAVRDSRITSGVLPANKLMLAADALPLLGVYENAMMATDSTSGQGITSADMQLRASAGESGAGVLGVCVCGDYGWCIMMSTSFRHVHTRSVMSTSWTDHPTS
jgi:hypothetical protein